MGIFSRNSKKAGKPTPQGTTHERKQDADPNQQSNVNEHALAMQYPKTGPLSAMDYRERLVSSEGTQTVMMPGSGCILRYAYVSQRGYYPEAPEKANQDSFSVKPNFLGDQDQHYFAVYDGHGEMGTECSHHARDHVPANLAADSHFGVSPEVAFQHAMVMANNSLHATDIDDSMSGTTAISCLIRGRILYVANVGDSRAVLAVRQGDKLTAQDLSHDQTPYRRDEADRVKRCGARVLTLDQLEGLKDPNVECWGTEEESDGDPPRLWAPDGMYPGTAFTRSIGDSTAERFGVFAEPEVAIRQLNAQTPFLVLASDGVFEFLPSQSVVNMVNKFSDPHEACIAVVAESYRLWLQYETRTDDITMIVVQISGLADETPQLALPTPIGPPIDYSTLTHSMMVAGVQRPSPKQSRPAIENMEVLDDQYQFKVVSKTPEEVSRLELAVKNNFFFSNLSQVQWTMLFDIMQREIVRAGQVVIKQGDQGDDFYIVDSGQFDVYVSGIGGDPLPMLVHTYSTMGGKNPSFGELALMYGKPRAASVVARTDGVLWKLERPAFKAVLHQREPKVVMKILRSVEVLANLTVFQIQAIADLMEETEILPGEYIVRQGEMGNEFYLIVSGELVCDVRKNPADQSEVPKQVLRLGPNQYFGERALQAASRRAANVSADGVAVLMRLSRDSLESQLGPLQAMVDRKIGWEGWVREQADLVLAQPIAAPNSIDLEELRLCGTVYMTDCTQVCLMEHTTTGEILTVRLTSVADATTMGRERLLLRQREITRTMTPTLFVPAVPRAQVTNSTIAELISTNALCTVELLMYPKPFDEESARFVAASLVLALEHLHMSGILYRSLSIETAVLTEHGHVQLVDFRFAKRYEGRTYSLCGNPEYLAPEIVHSVGHSDSVDWWALGVFIYAMLSRSTPFATARDDELRIYRKITARNFVFPQHFTHTTCDLIDQLLQVDPKRRLGYGHGGVDQIKNHLWFKGVDWDALGRHEVQPPSGIRERIYNFEGLDSMQLNTAVHDGDISWADDF